MKFFITGAHGFIGSHLHAYLASIGHDVMVFDRTRPLIKIPEDIDCVIHLAGEIYDESKMNLR